MITTMSSSGNHRGVLMSILCIAAVSTISQRNCLSAHAFVPQTIIITRGKSTIYPIKPTLFHNHHQTTQPLLQLRKRYSYITTQTNMAKTTSTTTQSSDEADLTKEIKSMKAKEIRTELESYGIPTKSFFEKSELVEALVSARKEGKTPISVNSDASGSADSSTSDAATSSETTSASSSSDSDSRSSTNRQERLSKEMEICKSMKVGELKKELESYGVSTKSYFEKSEFVRAVAEARVDGVKKSSAGASSSSSSRSSSSRVKEEPTDPSYRDVTVTKFGGDKSLLGFGSVIDVKAR